MRAKPAPKPKPLPPSVLPGAVLGILGGGQLGRMIALEARRMGYGTVVLDPAKDGPAAQVCDRHIHAPVDDVSAAVSLAQASDVVTLEWELIPAEVLRKVEAVRPLHPSSIELHIIQDRLRQKEFLKDNDFSQTAYEPVNDRSSLEKAAAKLGYPCLLKRRGHGYDGKGQYKLSSPNDLAGAKSLLEAPCVLEAWVPHVRELSVILARGRDGKTAVFPLAENAHRNGILHTTRVPVRVPRVVADHAEKLALSLAAKLGHVGVMAVELFALSNGELLVNEIAPRVHNSGHYTLGACATSQFEQHVRAVSGLPLGDTTLLTPAVMVNLLGDLWGAGEPDWGAALARPDLKLHLYGKTKAAPGRKMGHALLLGPDADKLLGETDGLLAKLSRRG